MEARIRAAAQLIARSGGLLVTAGAGLRRVALNAIAGIARELKAMGFESREHPPKNAGLIPACSKVIMKYRQTPPAK
jgi:hypothetical protein